MFVVSYVCTYIFSYQSLYRRWHDGKETYLMIWHSTFTSSYCNRNMSFTIVFKTPWISFHFSHDFHIRNSCWFSSPQNRITKIHRRTNEMHIIVFFMLGRPLKDEEITLVCLFCAWNHNIYLFIYLYTYLSEFSVWMCVCMSLWSLYLFVYLSVCLPTYIVLSFCLFICANVSMYIFLICANVSMYTFLI